MAEGNGVSYSVKELLQRIDEKIDQLSVKLDGKADLAEVEVISQRLTLLEILSAEAKAREENRAVFYGSFAELAKRVDVLDKFTGEYESLDSVRKAVYQEFKELGKRVDVLERFGSGAAAVGDYRRFLYGWVPLVVNVVFVGLALWLHLK